MVAAPDDLLVTEIPEIQDMKLAPQGTLEAFLG